MNRKLIYAPLLLLGLVAAGAIAFAVFRPIQVLPRMSLAPGFALVDQDGHRLTSEDLRGNIVFYSFGYPGCGEPCGAIAEVMREVREGLAGIAELEGLPVRLVTIAFDGGPDGSDALRIAAAEAGADGSVWSFATAEPEALKTLIGGGFEVYYSPRPDGGYDFDPAFFLVDGWGILRAEYRYGVPKATLLLEDLRLLAREARAAEGAARLAYEAAHLFACYPR